MKCTKCNYTASVCTDGVPLCALHGWPAPPTTEDTIPKIEILLKALGISCELSWPHRRHYYSYTTDEPLIRDCEILVTQGFMKRGKTITFDSCYEYGTDKATGKKTTTGVNPGYAVRVYWITPEGTEYCDSARLRITGGR